MLLILLAAAGCATGGARVNASTLPPCPVQTPDPGWHQVSAADVTFCVPGHWSRIGSRRWGGDGGSVEWGTGTLPRRVETRTVVVRVERGGVPPTVPRRIPGARVDRWTETLGGAPAELWIAEEDGEMLRTGADWDPPVGLYMTGEARTRKTAELQVEIYRTARPVQ